MINTPRTDDQVRDYGDNPFVSPDFARQLERELIQAQQTIAQKDGELLGLREVAQDAVSRLEGHPCACQWLDDTLEGLGHYLSTPAPVAVVPCKYCLKDECDCSDADVMPDMGDK